MITKLNAGLIAVAGLLITLGGCAQMLDVVVQQIGDDGRLYGAGTGRLVAQHPEYGSLTVPHCAVRDRGDRITATCY